MFCNGFVGQYEDGAVSEYLRAVNMPIFDRDTCNRVILTTGTVTQKMICAGYLRGWRGGCFGDSGGPLVCKNKQVGVYNWSDGRCAEYPGVFANVGWYRPWILRDTKIDPKNCETYIG